MTAQQNEDLRHAVLAVTAVRHPAALTARQIRRRVAEEIDFQVAEQDVNAALEFLKSIGHVMCESDSLGSTKYWMATAGGVLAYERGQR